jgi:hypothetical protein
MATKNIVNALGILNSLFSSVSISHDSAAVNLESFCSCGVLDTGLRIGFFIAAEDLLWLSKG